VSPPGFDFQAADEFDPNAALRSIASFAASSTVGVTVGLHHNFHFTQNALRVDQNVLRSVP
jgi:hypothetical protein